MNRLFKKNMGALDRGVRVVAGLILLVLAALELDGALTPAFVLFSVPLLLSGLSGICPTYSLLGISTKRVETCC